MISGSAVAGECLIGARARITTVHEDHIWRWRLIVNWESVDAFGAHVSVRRNFSARVDVKLRVAMMDNNRRWSSRGRQLDGYRRMPKMKWNEGSRAIALLPIFYNEPKGQNGDHQSSKDASNANGAKIDTLRRGSLSSVRRFHNE